jgi:general secretion pathway protein I
MMRREGRGKRYKVRGIRYKVRGLAAFGCSGRKEPLSIFASHLPPPTSHQGFTLLEVLLALVIVGIAISVVLQLFSFNLRNVANSEDYVKAAMVAESKLRQIVDSADLTERQWSENTGDGYRFDVVVSPIEKDKAQAIDMKLLQVDLSMSWKSGSKNRTISVKTLKLIKQSDEKKEPVNS